jgi:hypothetical protein
MRVYQVGIIIEKEPKGLNRTNIAYLNIYLDKEKAIEYINKCCICIVKEYRPKFLGVFEDSDKAIYKRNAKNKDYFILEREIIE